MNVLLINGHPRKNSLSTALMNSYLEGAQQSGTECKVLFVIDLQFNLHVTHCTPHQQESEPSIAEAQELIKWADHIVFIYPTWWGTMPALLKGFIDRVFISGFAFEEIEGGTGYAPLLPGKTAQIITTMDTPPLIYKLVYRAPGNNAMAKSILGFCGFIMLPALNFGPVRHSTEATRKKWLFKSWQQGYKLKNGVLSARKKITLKAIAWIKAIRLQFYPMTFIAYTAGALGAKNNNYGFHSQAFWYGYLWLFFAEVATVLSNEYFDYSTDRSNKFFGPFNGGSRVIVNRLLSFKEIKTGIAIAIVLALSSFSVLLWRLGSTLNNIVLISAAFFVVALGYTIPPLKLSYRGLGELTVGITHSFAVVLCGYLFQGGSLQDSFSWWLSLPLFLSVLPSIILAGIPDYEADAIADKKTIAVRLGSRGAIQLAIFFTAISALSVIIFSLSGILPKTFSGILYGVIPHSILLVTLLGRHLQKKLIQGRIDALIITALTYLMWFAIVPLLNLL
jgi:1,4-dihydroxy-2-naphthoate octaprenyltransferase